VSGRAAIAFAATRPACRSYGRFEFGCLHIWVRAWSKCVASMDAQGLDPGIWSNSSLAMGMGKHSVGRFVLCPPLKREQWETTHAFSDVLEDLGHHPTLGVIDIFDAPEYLKVKPASM